MAVEQPCYYFSLLWYVYQRREKLLNHFSYLITLVIQKSYLIVLVTLVSYLINF